jgi:hypothetical protein
MLSALEQIQVLWPTTQLERLIEENIDEAYHQAVDQAEVGLDAIAEQIANHLDLGGDHP